MKAIGRILIASIGLFISVGMVWGTVQILATTTIKDDPILVETVGLTGFFMAAVASGIAFINGIVLGAVTSGEHLLKRMLWHLAVYLMLAVGWSVYSIKSGSGSDLSTLVSRHNYAAFEKRIDGHLNEAWAAALIHADPEAMKLCIKHGADAKTWARVDTSLFASQPNEPPIELIISHRYWSSLIPDQQRMAKESLKLLSEHGADLNAKCVEAGTKTPLEYATEKKLSALIDALHELGITR
ncbi:MAG: hypothetical protein JNJ83_16710 [Verrucomicrobiaceae bacterium]|nr:hypothetical protein [Verrucomicrobiaceae bacterium]